MSDNNRSRFKTLTRTNSCFQFPKEDSQELITVFKKINSENILPSTENLICKKSAPKAKRFINRIDQIKFFIQL